MAGIDELNIYSQVADWMKHGYKLHRAEVVKGMQDEINFLRARLDEKDKEIGGLREAIAVFEFNTEHDPIYNLEGAISDLEGRIKDEVILQTLYRVQEQLGRCYHAALNAAPNTDGAQ